ncbi:MAG: hypothetical protein U0183_34325 [Polyangiaceae bacterium]
MSASRVAIVAVWLGVARLASAAEPVGLEVVGAPCLTVEGVATEAAPRGVAVVPIDPAARPRVAYRASVVAEGDAVDVRIEGADGDRAIPARTLHAGSCDEARRAVAVLVAIGHGGEPEPEPTPPAPLAPLPTSAPKDAPGRLAPRARPEAPSAAFTAAIGAGARSLVEGQATFSLSMGLARPSNVLPWVEASFVVGVPKTIVGGGASGEFTYLAGRIAAAPVGLRSGAWSLSPFLGLEVGALGASGVGATRVDRRSRPSVLGSLGVRSHYEISRRFFASGGVEGLVVGLRDDFVIVGGGTTYRPPAVGFAVSLAFGVTIP